MPTPAPKEVTRYISHTRVTDPGTMAAVYEGLPQDMGGLVEVIQGVFLHIHWAERYGVTPTEEQKGHVQTRLVSRILEIVMDLDASPLTTRRPLEKRFYGNCRDYSVLLCSILRSRGVPARARCGFGTYFWPGQYEDHWVCEYWNGERWVVVDAQLDELQRNRLKVGFSTLDMPKGRFVNASEAWLRCREQGEDPNKYGIFDMRGLWFIRGNLLRELAALNDAEMLPWDVWGLMNDEDAHGDERSDYEQLVHAERHTLLDKVARALVEDDEEMILSLYRNEPGLSVPKEMIVAGL
ncbi:MAG TPA: transglutaminase domain-containing protein [Firmicutes bacterium]|nr:transglutaminase domain-containing protein [Candidatus Fermentithermobacillaceae bacterium]